MAKVSVESLSRAGFTECAKGHYSYCREFGYLSVRKPELDLNLRLRRTTVMRIAGATKLITSVAAMQCVDRGLIGLDDDVTKFAEEVEGVAIVTGYKGDDPILKLRKQKMTLRHLLSHSSGFCYDILSDLLIKWRKNFDVPLQPELPRLVDRYCYPLLFEPGTEWMYSPSIDWAGRVVERLTDMSLEDYLRENICAPLHISSMTFFLQAHGGLIARRADMTVRNPESGKVEHSDEAFWDEDPEEALGGLALYSSPEDFFKVMSSLLFNDGKLLSPAAVDEFFSPQLTDSARASQSEFLSNPRRNLLMGGFLPFHVKKDHGLGGILTTEDVEEGWRRKGTMSWNGSTNFFWVRITSTSSCFT